MKLYNIFDTDWYGRDPVYVGTVAAENETDALAYWRRVVNPNPYLDFIAEPVVIR